MNIMVKKKFKRKIVLLSLRLLVEDLLCLFSSVFFHYSPGLFMLSGLKVNRLSPLCSMCVTPSQPIVWQWRVQQAWWLATHTSRSAGRAVSNGEHLWVLGRVDLKQRMPGARGSALAHNALPRRARAHPNSPKPQCGEQNAERVATRARDHPQTGWSENWKSYSYGRKHTQGHKYDRFCLSSKYDLFNIVWNFLVNHHSKMSSKWMITLKQLSFSQIPLTFKRLPSNYQAPFWYVTIQRPIDKTCPTVLPLWISCFTQTYVSLLKNNELQICWL